MNNKKAKQLRKMAKTLKDNQTEYNDYSQPEYQQVGFNFIKTKSGTPCTMKSNCTRAIYKKLKKTV